MSAGQEGLHEGGQWPADGSDQLKAAAMGMVVTDDDEDMLDISRTGISVFFTLSGSLMLALSSLITRKALRLASSRGPGPGDVGFRYLQEPTWWAGTAATIAGELANFAAYAYSPPTLVTPLGSFGTIIITAMVGHVFMNEPLNMFGVLGCVVAAAGAATMVLTVPEEREFASILEIWNLIWDPFCLLWVFGLLLVVATLAYRTSPRIGSCSALSLSLIIALVGSISVLAAKGLAIATKLTLEGSNQFGRPETYLLLAVVGLAFVVHQIYANQAADVYKTGIVVPISCVLFNLATITGYLIMFKVTQTVVEIGTEICGFITVVSGVFLIYSTSHMDTTSARALLRVASKDRDSRDEVEAPSVSPSGTIVHSRSNSSLAGQEGDRRALLRGQNHMANTRDE